MFYDGYERDGIISFFLYNNSSLDFKVTQKMRALQTSAAAILPKGRDL